MGRSGVFEEVGAVGQDVQGAVSDPPITCCARWRCCSAVSSDPFAWTCTRCTPCGCSHGDMGGIARLRSRRWRRCRRRAGLGRSRRAGPSRFRRTRYPHHCRLTSSRITEVTNDLIENLAGKPCVNLVDDFAYPLPATAICRLLGVPRQDYPASAAGPARSSRPATRPRAHSQSANTGAIRSRPNPAHTSAVSPKSTPASRATT